MKKKLTSYEEDLLWMSYRYCIGRSTISTNQHAGNIAKHAYDRLSDDRKQFMAYDIRRCIEDVLRIAPTSFYMQSYMSNQDNPDYKPLEIFLNILKDNDIKDENDLSEIKSIYLKFNNGIHDVSIEKQDKQTYGGNMFVSCHNLFAWADLASCFDMRNHKLINCVNPDTGNNEYIEAFESYIPVSPGSFEFKRVWRPVKQYLARPWADMWIGEEHIRSIINK